MQFLRADEKFRRTPASFEEGVDEVKRCLGVGQVVVGLGRVLAVAIRFCVSGNDSTVAAACGKVTLAAPGSSRALGLIRLLPSG